MTILIVKLIFTEEVLRLKRLSEHFFLALLILLLIIFLRQVHNSENNVFMNVVHYSRP